MNFDRDDDPQTQDRRPLAANTHDTQPLTSKMDEMETTFEQVLGGDVSIKSHPSMLGSVHAPEIVSVSVTSAGAVIREGIKQLHAEAPIPSEAKSVAILVDDGPINENTKGKKQKVEIPALNLQKNQFLNFGNVDIQHVITPDRDPAENKMN